jgi:hypothetical protein
MLGLFMLYRQVLNEEILHLAEGGQSVTWIKYTVGSNTNHSTPRGAEVIF